MDCEYWKDIVARLRTENYWAAHVLATCIGGDGSNLSRALECVSDEEIIKNTIYAYEDWLAQPSCDQILLKFEKQKVLEVYKQIENPSEKMSLGFSGILEDFEDGLSNNTSN